MLFCGSYSYLKENLLQTVKEAYEKKPLAKLTFIVHSNVMRKYIKEFLTDNLEIIVNTEFYTFIDISKKIAQIEPLQDFDKEMIFRKILYENGYKLDGIPSELSLITQQIKEQYIPVEIITPSWIKEIIEKYENFKNSEGYYDREDVHKIAIEKEADFFSDYIFVFGIRSIQKLHQDVLKKLKKHTDNFYVFVPFHLDSGIYGSYWHFSEIKNFYEHLTDSFAETEKNIKDRNVLISKKILNFKEREKIKNENIKIIKGFHPYDEVEKVASIISSELIDVPYSKVAIISPSEQYNFVLKEVLEKYYIPFRFQEDETFIEKFAYKKVLDIFKIKIEEFSKESIIRILPIIDIEDISKAHQILASSQKVKNFQELEKYIFSDLEKNLKEFLKLIYQLKDKDLLENYVKILEDLTDYIKDENLKQFLRDILKELKENPFYKKLFHEIEYPLFYSIIKSFFEKDAEKTDKSTEAVEIIKPISAEANNFEYIFFLGLNSGVYPSSLKEISLTIPALENFEYPYHILMQEILTFCSILDKGKKIYFSFSEKNLDGEKNIKSLLLDELERVLENYHETYPEKAYPQEKELFKEYPEFLLEKKEFKKLYEKFKEEKNFSDYKFDFVSLDFPVSATQFQVYVQCPYIYFVKHILEIPEKEKVYIDRISPTELGKLIHQVLYIFYKDLDDTYEKEKIKNSIKKLEETFMKKIEKLFSNLSPSALPFEKHQVKLTLSRIKDFLEFDTNRLKKENKKVHKKLLEKEIRNKHFKGRVDRADVDKEGKIYIYDYKTGKNSYTELGKEILSKYIQLLVYAQIIGEKVKEVGIFAINDNRRRFLFTLSKEEYLTFVPYMEKYLNLLKNKNFPPIENDNCKYCIFETFCPKLKQEE